MTPDDELERELESIRPRPPSAELRRKITGRLVPRMRRWQWTALAAAAAAAVAGITVGLILHRPPAPPVGPPPAVAAEMPPPSVLAYRQAFARSPAALDALLDEEAVRSAADAPSASDAAAPGLLALKGYRE